MSKVLILNNENVDFENVKALLEKSGYSVSISKSVSDLVNAAINKKSDVILTTTESVQNKVNIHPAMETQMETIFSLAKLAQSRDDDTGEHLTRVQNYCRILSEELAKNSPYSQLIDNDFITDIVNASTLHDIGKVGISDLILLKNAKLTEDEYEVMKTHTIIGAQTLEDVHSKFGDNSFIRMGKIIARSHHERWDGKGYPDGLSGEHIPLPARIMAIADVYDALSTKRVYKDAFPQEKCVQIIKEGRGTQFDPYIVDAFLRVADKFDDVRQMFCDKVS
ncbi:HD domain-containing protein [bacterium]|nr:HD domain-containing protein [bacterium]